MIESEINYLSDEFKKYFIEEKVGSDLLFELPRREIKENKINFYNEINKRNEEIDNLYLLAKLGSESSLNELLEELIESSISITYSYKKSLSYRIDIDISDLKGILYQTFNHFMSLENFFVNCENFFKFIYMRDINQYLRKKYVQEESKIKENAQNDLNSDNLTLDELNHNDYKSDDEIVNIILKDPRSNINEKDKVIIELILLQYTIKEIAKEINLCYSVTFRRVKKVLNKCELYIKNYLPDIFIRYKKSKKVG